MGIEPAHENEDVVRGATEAHDVVHVDVRRPFVETRVKTESSNVAAQKVVVVRVRSAHRIGVSGVGIPWSKRALVSKLQATKELGEDVLTESGAEDARDRAGIVRRVDLAIHLARRRPVLASGWCKGSKSVFLSQDNKIQRTVVQGKSSQVGRALRGDSDVAG